MIMAFIYGVGILGVFSAFGLYQRKIQLSPTHYFFTIAKATTATIAIYFMAKSFTKSDLFIPLRLVLLQWGILLLSILTIHRLVAVPLLTKLFSKTDMRRRVVIIGDTEVAARFIDNCDAEPNCGMLVIGLMDNAEQANTVLNVPFLGDTTILPEVINLYNLEGAVICNPELHHQKLIDLVEQCVRLFGWVDIHTDMFNTLQHSSSADLHFDIPFVRMHGLANSLLYEFYKRIFDFTASLSVIVLLSPILISTAIAIKCTSPGPIFYIRHRVGKEGKPFRFYKFRSMVVDADQDRMRSEQIKKFIHNELLDQMPGKIVNNAHVTTIGKLIRKWAIDELPQLLNVLKGDMALVGPRPVTLSEYAHEDEWHRRRFAIKPGCTGLWKLHAAESGITFNDFVLFDIYYSRNMGPVLDTVVIFRTVWVILSGKVDG
jgi:exopolysaccharide biosynthesis polyprenyl glycosylphosphotransferase